MNNPVSHGLVEASLIVPEIRQAIYRFKIEVVNPAAFDYGSLRFRLDRRVEF